MENRFKGYEGRYNAETSATNAFGDIGEVLFKQVFEARGHKVIDKSKDLDWQLQDVDFEVTTKSGHTCTVEVKWDDRMAKTNNMFVEIGNNGWLNSTKAQFICYGDARNEIFYLFRTNKLKLYIKENMCSLRTITYPTKGKLVNINDFMDWCIDENTMFWKINIEDNEWENKGC